MKVMKKVLLVWIVVLMVTSLCACGSKGGSVSGGAVPVKTVAAQCDSDEAYLKENGYTVYVYSAYLESYASALGVEADSMLRMLYAYNNDGDAVNIYYFKTEAAARACYENDPTGSYKLLGFRVVYGDAQNLIK